jgi:hypothetical protein
MILRREGRSPAYAELGERIVRLAACLNSTLDCPRDGERRRARVEILASRSMDA